MNVLSINSFAGHTVKTVVAAFTDPKLPKRPDGIKEPASVAYVDRKGSHVAYIYEVEDARLGELMSHLYDRAAFMSSRVEGYTSDVQAGFPVMAAVGRVKSQWP